MKNSFFIPGYAADPAYILNRDSKRRQQLRDDLERIWARCGSLCGDKDFREMAKRDFHSCSWHLYLLDCLLERGCDVRKAGLSGPDILVVVNEKKIWIEAIAVRPGNSLDRVKLPKTMVVYSPDDKKIILRHTSVIRKKYEKYERYLAKGTVGENEPYLIALNAGLVTDADYTFCDPVSYLEQAVFGLGDEQCHVSLATGEITGISYRPQGSITKASNGSEVNTKTFLDKSYEGLSAIIYSTEHFATQRASNGLDISVLYNPNAKNPISRRSFRFGREKWVEKGHLKMKVHK